MRTSGVQATPPLVWAGAAAAALTVAVAGALEGFSVSIGGYVGAGNSQRLLPPVERTFTLLGYGHPRYLAAFALALVAVVAAARGWRHVTGWVTLATIVVAATAGLALTSAVLDESNGRLGGVFLVDAVNEVQKVAAQRPEASNPAYGASGYSADAEIGWQLTVGAFATLLAISSIALGRRIADAVGWITLAVIFAAVILVGMVPGENCGGSTYYEHDPDSNPLGLLAAFGSLACAGLGVGALLAGRWRNGAAAVGVGLPAAFVAWVVLAGKDCAFY